MLQVMDGVTHCAAYYDESHPPVVELPQLVGCTLIVHTDHPVIQAAHNLVVVHLNLRTIRYEKQVSAHLITMDGLHCAMVYSYQREYSAAIMNTIAWR